MKFLSRFRRHRFAGPLLLLAGLLFAGFGYTVAQAASQTVVTANSDKATLIAEGKEIFARGCSSCHGLNAEGA
ncbi:MAG: cystathionine beta-lyase, partial [Actinobacteria bacterium]|nr:cystathionine beta-lyase [Actinomycetota bacterium]